MFFPGCLAVQSFRAEPSYTEVNPSAVAVLDCRVDNIGGECRWQKDGKVRKRHYSENCGHLSENCGHLSEYSDSRATNMLSCVGWDYKRANKEGLAHLERAIGREVFSIAVQLRKQALLWGANPCLVGAKPYQYKGCYVHCTYAHLVST